MDILWLMPLKFIQFLILSISKWGKSVGEISIKENELYIRMGFKIMVVLSNIWLCTQSTINSGFEPTCLHQAGWFLIASVQHAGGEFMMCV